jgi:tRNA(Ile)-lysidine synthase
MPLLKTLNPAVVRNIQQTAENLTEAQKVLDAVMEKYRDCKELDLNELKEYGSSEYIVFEWAKNYGFNGSQIRQLLSSQETVDNLEGDLKCGRMFTSFMGYDLLLDRGRLMVEPSLKPIKPLLIPEEGTYVHDVWKIQVRRLHVANGMFEASKVPHIATLDAAKVVFPLTVRRVEKGDWMQPYGMRGRKLLSDLMTDKKYSFFEKRRQLVVVDAQGVIVWVVGLRTDQRVAVTEATREVLMIKVDK